MRKFIAVVLALSAAALEPASISGATPVPTSAVLHVRVFNDCPISILTTTNNYPASIQISDQNVPPQPLCAGFANLHTWRFSADGANALQFVNGDTFSYECDLVLNGAGEGGLNMSPWFSPEADGLFNVRTTDGEIACFGGRMPFFTFTGAFGLVYVNNTPIHLGIVYKPNGLSAASPAQIIYNVRYNGTNYTSGLLNFDQGNPAEDPPHGLWGALTPWFAGGHVKMFVFPSGQPHGITATWSNIKLANSAPTDVSLSPASVEENKPIGTLVGTLSSTDPDAGNKFTYALVSGTGDGDNSAFQVLTDSLVTKAVFDFETRSAYSVRVQTTDQDGLSIAKSLPITILDVNEAPTAKAGPDQTIISGQTVTLDGSGSTDPDTDPAKQIVSYAWDFGDGQTGSGALVTHKYTGSGTFHAVLTVTDGGGLSATDEALIVISQLVGINDRGTRTGADQYIRFPDLTTGVAQVVGVLGSSFNHTDGMAVLPGTIHDPDHIFAADDNRLIEIDPNTGAATEIGHIGFSRVDGLCFEPSTRELFGVTYGSNQIIHIDFATGHGTLVASHVIVGHRLNDMTFSPDGRMFIVTNDSPPTLFQVNPATGAKLAKWTLSGTKQIEAILWSQDGKTLYCAAQRAGFADLATIDLGAKQVVFVSASHSGSRDIEALAWIGRTPPCVQCPGLAAKAIPAAGSALHLFPNVPNPFNPTTSISFDLPEPAQVELSVHDAVGHLVATLIDGPTTAGHHDVLWTGTTQRGDRVASGVYFYTLRAAGRVEKRRMLLLK